MHLNKKACDSQLLFIYNNRPLGIDLFEYYTLNERHSNVNVPECYFTLRLVIHRKGVRAVVWRDQPALIVDYGNKRAFCDIGDGNKR